MNMGEIIGAMWELPWWQLVMIAAVDDMIVLVKAWPIWLFILFIMVAVAMARTK